jgi:CRP/FNR family cyclic AMP-dependent transcriptional regulator
MNNTAEIFDKMKKMQMFSSLTNDELSALMDKIAIKNFKKNEVILYEDDTNNYMYLVLSGRVKVIQNTEGGKEIILAIHKAGESFGELSLIDCKTSSASVLALEHTTAAIINKINFFNILYDQKKVLNNMLQMFCLRLRDSWSRVQMANLRTASQRVTMLLNQLASEHGEEVPEGMLLNIRLTHQNMADMTGLTREAVTRVLDKLQKEGLVSIRKDKKIFLLPSFQKDLALRI